MTGRRRYELCPVGEVARDRHLFDPATGHVTEWHVMGDPRTTVTVCKDCYRPLLSGSDVGVVN